MNNMEIGGNTMGMNNMGMGGSTMGMNTMGMMVNNSMGMGNMGPGNYNEGGYNTGMRTHNNQSEPRGIKRPRTAVDLESKIMRKIFVGNIDFGTSEDDLKTHFEQYGDIEDVRIHKNQETGKPKGFGFITFVSSSGVDNVQMCRPHMLQGKTLDTKRALPNSQDDVRVKKIFIGGPEDEKHLGKHTGLNEDIQDEDLNNHFSQYGVVVKIYQFKWDNGKKRGYGYIEFDDEDSVDKVCLIGIHEVLGVRLEVKKAVEKNSAQRSNVSSYVPKENDNRGAKRSRKEQIDPESKVMRKIFIGNLNLSTTEEKLKEYFEQFGSTELVQLPLHMDSGKSRGFAFITYEKASSVDSCQTARPHKLDGSFIETTRATPKHDLGNPEAEAKVKKIYIGGANDERVSGHCGLTEDISDEDLEDYFGQFGIVTKVDQKIWEDTGKKRGYGYIEFDDEDTVDKIVLLGVHVVKGVRLEAKKGLNKDQLQKKAMGGMNTGNRMGGAGMGGNNMGGGGMQNNMKGGFMQNRGDNNMGNMMGQMQSMMGSMSSGNMNKSNMMGNMEQMQKMIGNMQNNMGTGGMGSEKNMQMMQNMMNMQNMMGNMQNASGSSSDQNMAMMTSMQQMMMNMMSMCTQMMSQGMNNSQTSGNNNPAPKSTGSSYSNTSQGNVSGQSNTSSGYSSQSNSSYGTQGMSNYTTGYGSSGSRFTSPPPSTSRYNTGMGNTSSYIGMGANTSSTGMGQGNMSYSGSGMMGQQNSSAYSGMGNTSRGGGPVRGGMGANRGNPYSRN